MHQKISLELVQKAVAGNKEVLEQLFEFIRDKIYGIALRMLWNPDDAEDATQEILIRILTHLSQFKGDSTFSTWAYRVATNYLLNEQKRSKIENLNFKGFAADLELGKIMDSKYKNYPENSLLIYEAKIGCSQALLQCLDRKHRLAFILGEIFELKSSEAAELLDISRDNFRQQFSRARKKIIEFMTRHCGVVNQEAPCRCHQKINHNIANKRMSETDFIFASHPVISKWETLISQIDALSLDQRPGAFYRSHPNYKSPDSLKSALADII